MDIHGIRGAMNGRVPAGECVPGSSNEDAMS